MHNADVVIIGAGITGLASAYWLAKAGAKVIVLDKGRTAAEASSRATGFLSLRGEQPMESALAAEAEKLWDTLDEELGYPTEWKQQGRLWVATNAQEWADMQLTYEHFCTTAIPFELIDADRCRKIVPSLLPGVTGGIYTHRSGHGNPQRTSQAFAWAFQDRGGVIIENSPAIDILVEGGRVKGVKTPDNIYYAPVVVNCAGPQLAKVASMVGVDIPVATVRLESMVTAPLPPLFDVAMVGNGLSLRQTRRGNIHFNGGPHEWIDVSLTEESAKPNTPIIRNIAGRLAELMPSIAHIPLLRTWAGIVDVTPDQVCIVDRLNDPEGLIIACTSGHGFGMAVSVGVAVKDLALEGRTNMPIDALKLERFKDLPANWKELRKWQPGSYNT
ncbi:NAD(P)/FAD-dependent oxidoreductase [Pseudomonas taiwanensis]|uniref:NAD(P)/FAD-dependent oxidoreductase n=1 Tax=Pseudomonas taiwanensis TaxID=470150 RepID=UPI001646F57B|nr:FAD-dependent oxidoreductase [Pseudomonas taiwanensis]MBC3492459.1 FAD-binding oxidoreductase [Pseudomonas taiwanensis]